MPVVVLPDVPVPPALTARIAQLVGTVLFRHPSGRPWIAGTADGRRVVSARTGDLDIVAIGTTMTVDDDDLARLAAGHSSVVELDTLAAGLAEGDVLVFARQHGRLRSQAPPLLTKSLCWAVVDGVHLVADEQATLRDLAGLRPDPAVVASRLTNAEISHPFGLNSIWAGVRPAGPGQWLDSRQDRPPVPVTWWRPPEPDGSLEDLVGRLHDDIAAALRLRTWAHQTVSADLSGGLDSTTLNFFLAGIGRKAHTLFLETADMANNDHIWAGRAASELDTEHRVVPYADLVPYLLDERTCTVETCPEGPSMANTAVGAVPLVLRAMADTDTSLHLNGHAGDALFGPVSTMLWSLMRSGERGRLRRTWRLRLLNRYRLGTTVRMLASNNSYREDLLRIAGHTFDGRDEDITSWARWVTLPNAHPALTETAREHLRRAAADAARDEPAPLAADRTSHQILQYLVAHGNAVRRMNQAATPGAGVLFDSPYLDRRIVETSLALRIGDRAHQRPPKPLLAAARPAAMSLDYFTRTDKGDYTAETFHQHKALKPLLHDLFANGSALEEMGLVSAERIVRAASEFTVSGTSYADLDNIVFAERWLRSVHGT
ncbi:asparagine synthase [Micromonospora sonchi]|uniref:Asparagine synthase n=1 Tax=Micromonospora sonchi TaxID=1763543 RepID=A0A917U008_9ACTN|nr:asparagine synthase-related protein [Micromonospora sonchi]GGM47278.1 asparagine synthase [Micromonospora sonchi]